MEEQGITPRIEMYHLHLNGAAAEVQFPYIQKGRLRGEKKKKKKKWCWNLVITAACGSQRLVL